MVSERTNDGFWGSAKTSQECGSLALQNTTASSVRLCQKASTTSCSKPLESARADGPARAWLLRCPRSGRRRLPRTAPPAPRCPAQRPPEASTAAHPAPRCPAQRLPEASTGRAPAPRCPAQRPPEAATGRTSAAASAPQASPPAAACAILAAHHALRQTVRRAPSAAPWPPHRRYVAPRSGPPRRSELNKA